MMQSIPRFDAHGNFVKHSLLGTLEDYNVYAKQPVKQLQLKPVAPIAANKGKVEGHPKINRNKIKPSTAVPVSTQSLDYVSGNDYRGNRLEDEMKFWRVPELKHGAPLALTRMERGLPSVKNAPTMIMSDLSRPSSSQNNATDLEVLGTPIPIHFGNDTCMDLQDNTNRVVVEPDCYPQLEVYSVYDPAPDCISSTPWEHSIGHLVLRAPAGIRTEATILVKNTGTSTLHLKWTKSTLENRLEVPLDNFQRFFFNNTPCIIVPGDVLHIRVAFLSSNAGVFNESWHLEATPGVGNSFLVGLCGMAASLDPERVKREAIQKRLELNAMLTYTRRFVGSLIDRAIAHSHARSNTGSAGPLKTLEEDVFLSVNTGICASCSLRDLSKLKTLYKDAWLEVHYKGGKNRQRPEACRLDTAGAPKGKETAKPALKVSMVVADEAVVVEEKIEVPEWSLRLVDLEATILVVEEPLLQQGLLERLNEIICSLSALPQTPLVNAANYEALYAIVGDSLGNVATTHCEVRTRHGVPKIPFVLAEPMGKSLTGLDRGKTPSNVKVAPGGKAVADTKTSNKPQAVSKKPTKEENVGELIGSSAVSPALAAAVSAETYIQTREVLQHMLSDFLMLI